ncbi:S1C family serine protease [Paenibacillus hamazuiensis]|uniref:S1C family serine protease n=1 Tax=Paenibacillus hamazuiensis TaxID=2936508 RepID=UPI00200E1149|nr:trypsin-like peptidase domain-containing protein [Paenibacillus hamazuiensis]
MNDFDRDELNEKNETLNTHSAEEKPTVLLEDDESLVEITPPRMKRTFGFSRFTPDQRRKSYKSTFAAFMAGAVVVGSLMFASDKMNLFTGTQAVPAATGTAPAGTGKLASSSGGGAAVTNSAFSLGTPESVSQIAEQASPAVVKIETKVKQKSTRGGMYNDPFFRQFFGDGGSSGDDSNGLQESGLGTGFIFEKSGYILTNEHVIDGADEIEVTVQGYDKPFKAELLGSSYDLDLACLKITGDKDFPTLSLGNPDNTKVGDWVVAIGNPYGFDHTVTVGVLSAKERPISIPDSQGTREYKHLLQTDASINPGNSGGPLLNMYGEVIGINTAVNAEAQGIGFAIPTSTISSVLENLKNNVKIPKEPVPYIGVALQDIDQSWVSDLKLSSTDGAIVSQVDRKSPGFAAGLRPYDVIVAVNGEAVKTSEEIVNKVKALKVGDQAKLTIVRDGQKSDISVKVGDKNTEQQQQQQ